MAIWDGAYKIPWHEEEFSRRMLAEHLTQGHDLASRRVETIERQVAYLDGALMGGRAGRILDLGCGPGLYASRLARMGHRVVGVDFGPASIEYARGLGGGAEFVLGDVRTAEWGGPYDLAMMLFGEMNVFPPAEILGVLRRVRASLARGGRVALEVQPESAVEALGRAGDWVEEHEAGLFSEGPYRMRVSCRWEAESRVAVRTFTVESGEGERVYRDTAQAWSAEAMVELARAAGLAAAGRAEGWPDEGFELWVAERD